MKHPGKLDFLGWKFLSFFGSIRFTSLEIVSGKSKVSKVFISILFALLFLTGFAQETHNLEIIWGKGTPEDTLFFTYGSELTSGDFNGDGYSDIALNGDSIIDPLHGIWIFKAYILFGGNPMDSVPDVWMIGRTDTSGLGNSIASAGDVNGDSYDDM